MPKNFIVISVHWPSEMRRFAASGGGDAARNASSGLWTAS